MGRAGKEEVPGIVNDARFSDVPKLVCKYGDEVFYETRRFIALFMISLPQPPIRSIQAYTVYRIHPRITVLH